MLKASKTGSSHVEGAGGFALCTNLHLPPETNLALYNSAIKQEDPNCQIVTNE
jgi:hypothetical protein